MCGIAAIVGVKARHTSEKITKMLEVQAHRGPDALGNKAFDGCVLGHVRLSIIDLSHAADQPMTSKDGRWTVIFNGEIYNYAELSEELSRQGAVFQTRSDTEVLLQAWIFWGEACLERLIGMFAFALWDDQEKRLYCARDRFGIKPLYYAKNHDGQIVLASEIKALFFAGVARARHDDVWADFLLNGLADHSEETFFHGVRRILPGHILTIQSDGALSDRKYWHMPEPFSKTDSYGGYDEAKEALRSLILDSVKIHWRSDVPCGVFVSGGVDSAVVLAASRQIGITDTRGFHFDFGGAYSERPWVEEIVSSFGTSMFYSTIAPEVVEEKFRFYLWHMEEPIGSLTTFSDGPLFAEGRSEGIKVFLDGSGADDLFGGYRQHQVAYLADLQREGKHQAYEKSLVEAASFWCEDAVTWKSQVQRIADPRSSHYGFDMTSPVYPDAVLLQRNKSTSVTASGSETLLSQRLLDGLTRTKIPKNMRFADKVSMAFSTELRVPFLNHVFAEFISRIPPDFLFRDGKPKAIFRDAMTGLVPTGVLQAPKREVQSPQREWLAGPLAPFVLRILRSKEFSERGLVDAKVAESYFLEYTRKPAENSFPIWQWINLEMWHRQFIDASLDEIERQPSF